MPRGKKNTTTSTTTTLRVFGAPPPKTLEDSTYENVPKFSLKGFKTQAKCVRVYDGDTAHFAFSLPGFGVGECNLVRARCRMTGYNSAEMKGDTEEERAAAQEAKRTLEETILGKIVPVVFGDFDMYGRPLIEVTVQDKQGASEDSPAKQVTLAEYLITRGLAMPYHGSGTKKWKKD
jgi:endonuclease YncB( thermonuclease family)